MKAAKALSGSEAIALAVKQANVDVVAAYPITPQTIIVERLAEYINNGELDAEYVPVESEHSALSVCAAASITGARVFTATASQGLALMHEMMYITSGLRCPVVMAVANRALSAPINIHRDHSDIMGSRDSGWVQIFVENNQQAYDMTLQAFRLAEDHDILLPVAVNLDGFFVSHAVEGVETLDDSAVAGFLPPRRPLHYLDASKPMSFGALASPEWYYKIRHQVVEAMGRVEQKLEQVEREYLHVSGRSYGALGLSQVEDAEVVILCAGAVAGTARTAARRLRERGVKVGVVSVRLYRPFPGEKIIHAVSNAEALLVIDLAMSPGAPSAPLGQDVKAMLFDAGVRLPVWNVVCGLGGRDVSEAEIEKLATTLAESATSASRERITYWGVAV